MSAQDTDQDSSNDRSDEIVQTQYVDLFQVGARNMQNYSLLRHVGKLNKPVLLKRAMSATVEEWLLAAEYLDQSLHASELSVLCLVRLGHCTSWLQPIGVQD